MIDEHEGGCGERLAADHRDRPGSGARVADDRAYRNAQQNPDRQNTRTEHDRALVWVMTAATKDDVERFKQFMDNEGFKRWMADTVVGLTYRGDRP